MKILAVDTSTKFLSLGIYDNSKVYEVILETGHKLSALISVIIKRSLDSLGLKICDFDYFACGLGPGSFTGLRIGLATIKGFAWTQKKPIIGISTLDVLAQNAFSIGGTIVPIVDAKRQLVYASVYQANGRSLKRVMPYMLLERPELFKKINRKFAKKSSIINILGDACDVYKQELVLNIKGAKILEKDYWYPKPASLISLAQEKIRNKDFLNAFNAEPIYLYPKECQIHQYHGKK